MKHCNLMDSRENLQINLNHPLMSTKSKPRKAPKPTVLRDFFASLDEKTKGLLLLTLNMEADTELSQRVKQDKLEAEFLRRAK
jgi:hypothetical protein